MENKKKYKELSEFVGSVNGIIGNQEEKVQRKLMKIYEKLKAYYEDYQSKLDELRLDNAAVDEKGILLLDEKGGYKFNKDGIKKFNKDKEELDEKEFDVTPVPVINTDGLEKFVFLQGWTTGIDFVETEIEGEIL